MATHFTSETVIDGTTIMDAIVYSQKMAYRAAKLRSVGDTEAATERVEREVDITCRIYRALVDLGLVPAGSFDACEQPVALLAEPAADEAETSDTLPAVVNDPSSLFN